MAPSSTSAAPAPAAPAAPTPAPPAVSTLLAHQLDDVVQQTRCATRQVESEAQEQLWAVKRAYNDNVAKPVNRFAVCASKQWGAMRQQYPAQMVAGFTAVALIASMPFGRLARVRNTTLALAASSLAVAPVQTVGWLALLRDRAAISVGMQAPSSVIVQAPVIAAPTLAAPQTQAKPAASKAPAPK